MGRSRIKLDEAFDLAGGYRKLPGRPKNDRKYIREAPPRPAPAMPPPDLNAAQEYYERNRLRPAMQLPPGKPTFPKATKRIMWHLYSEEGELIQSGTHRQDLVAMQGEGERIHCTIEAK